ncbi:MAG TPA: sigma-E factor negative regulatory protein [Steroidobacteraceae bacterium]|nr:sigma-E factor negative regulatory protein [Steroidobacteraceae bacterium]
MNEQEHSSLLSALFDGELPEQQAGMVIRRALRDTQMQHSWERYALIGACLRGDPIPASASVADRVKARVAAERDLNVAVLPVRGNAGGKSSPQSYWLGRGALGGAIAAGVAVLSIFVVRQMGPVTPDVLQVARDGSPVAAPGSLAAEQLPVGYTTPGENSPAPLGRVLDVSLSHYLVAHSEEAASALRSSYELEAEGATELTADQIDALR